MWMRTCQWFALVVLSFSVHANGSDAMANERNFVGKAYDEAGDTLLYTEQHRIQYDSKGGPVSGTVTYTSADGEPLAIKQLQYGKMPFAPSFQFDDQRIDNKVSVQVESDRLDIVSADGEERVDLPNDKPAVVDAGFNHFMQQHLAKLKQGKTLDLAFLAVGRAEFYGFEVSPERQTDNTVEIKLAPSTWVLSVLVDPIYLTYDKATGRLLRYQGLGNIEQVENGKGLDENYVVRIEYEYPE